MLKQGFVWLVLITAFSWESFRTSRAIQPQDRRRCLHDKKMCIPQRATTLWRCVCGFRCSQSMASRYSEQKINRRPVNHFHIFDLHQSPRVSGWMKLLILASWRVEMMQHLRNEMAFVKVLYCYRNFRPQPNHNITPTIDPSFLIRDRPSIMKRLEHLNVSQVLFDLRIDEQIARNRVCRASDMTCDSIVIPSPTHPFGTKGIHWRKTTSFKNLNTLHICFLQYKRSISFYMISAKP